MSDFARLAPNASGGVDEGRAKSVESARRARRSLVDADVPAAVVCAHCGDADCAGCRNEQTRSGVVAIVAWERPGAPALARLWATARATTFDSDRFFESLPDGPIAPALRFAFASELLASAAMALLAHRARGAHRAAVGQARARRRGAGRSRGWRPRGARPRDDPRRGARRARMGARPGARGARARAARRRARCGSVSTRPGGTSSSARSARSSSRAKEGLGKALSIGGVIMDLPGRSARAFLRGCYRLDGASAEPALRASYVAAAVATAVGAVAVIAALVAALLL